MSRPVDRPELTRYDRARVAAPRRTLVSRLASRGLALLVAALSMLPAPGGRSPGRAAFAGERGDASYSLVTLPVPEDLRLEVSGIAPRPDGRVALAIRRGEIWIADGVTDGDGERTRYRRFASGLHEPLGLAWHEGALWTVQRSELTRLLDHDGDDVADEYEAFARGWGVSGNYHEYAYGPVFDREGHAWITLNSTLGPVRVDDRAWRGWSIRVAPDGSWRPVSVGLRSPAGLGLDATGRVLTSDQQGNWVPTCGLHVLERGVFHGHVDSLRDCERAESPLKRPGALPQGVPFPEALARVPALRAPAVWLPYRKAGMSTTDIVLDSTKGAFGPFAGQLFVGEFTISSVYRVALEEVRGRVQGACFPFLSGFQCAVLRLAFASDGSLLVGETNRGWNSLGGRSYGLERVVFSGETPFEMLRVEATSKGFRVVFTRPFDRATLDVSRISVSSYTYLYHSSYGSPEIDVRPHAIESLRPSEDDASIEIDLDALRPGYVHELDVEGLRSPGGAPLRHGAAYYTLHRVP